MTFLRSVRESFNSRGGKEVASCYWSSASQQLYLLHCHSEFRRRKSPNLRPCWILLFRRGTLHSLIKQDCYYQFSCFGGRPNLSNAQPSIKTIQASVATLVLSINLMKWMPFCVLASGPKRCWINESAIWFAGPPSSLHEIEQWQGLWPLESEVYRQFVAYMVKPYYINFLWLISLLHLWSNCITFMVGVNSPLSHRNNTTIVLPFRDF